MKNKIFTSSYLGLESLFSWSRSWYFKRFAYVLIVGMGDTAILESKFRVKAALKNSDYEVRPQKIVVNLSPAGIKKRRSSVWLSHSHRNNSRDETFKRFKRNS